MATGNRQRVNQASEKSTKQSQIQNRMTTSKRFNWDKIASELAGMEIIA